MEDTYLNPKPITYPKMLTKANSMVCVIALSTFERKTFPWSQWDGDKFETIASGMFS